MPFRRRAGRRAPLGGLAAAVAILLLPAAALGAEWSSTSRVSNDRGTRLDSLHQLAAGNRYFHLVHARVGPGRTDDRVIYQRSASGGPRWPSRTLFAASNAHRNVIPNLAIDARGPVVAVAWRVRGPDGTTLFVRVSRDRGTTFSPRSVVASTGHADGLGVPAITVADGAIAVAWTNRANGKVQLRLSRNDGRTWKSARTMGRTKLSIDCRSRVTDGLVGLASAGRRIHLAWSHAKRRSCLAGSIRMRSSADRGKSWKRQRSVTRRRSFGWPELAARGNVVLATVQSSGGDLIVARSVRNGRAWSDRRIKARKGHNLSAADVVLLPRKRAMISYVEERIRNSRLRATKVVSRLSTNDGARFGKARTIAAMNQRLRMAPNLAARGPIIVVYQSGALGGSPRDLFVARLR